MSCHDPTNSLAQILESVGLARKNLGPLGGASLTRPGLLGFAALYPTYERDLSGRFEKFDICMAISYPRIPCTHILPSRSA